MAQPAIIEEIQLRQGEDPKLQKVREGIKSVLPPDFTIDDGLMKF